MANTVRNHENVNNAFNKWYNIVMNIIDNNVPRVQVKQQFVSPWFDGKLQHTRNKKSTTLRNAKRSCKPADWCKYRVVRNKLNRLSKLKRDNFITNLGHAVKENCERFWSFVKCKTGIKSVPKTVKWNDKEATNPTEQAALLNNYFNSVLLDPPNCTLDNNQTRQCESFFVMLL